MDKCSQCVIIDRRRIWQVDIVDGVCEIADQFGKLAHKSAGHASTAAHLAMLLDELRQQHASKPAWHDKPTVPGIWAFPPTARWSSLSVDLSQHEIDCGLDEWCDRRCFGPIPPDPTIKQS